MIRRKCGGPVDGWFLQRFLKGFVAHTFIQNPLRFGFEPVKVYIALATPFQNR